MDTNFLNDAIFCCWYGRKLLRKQQCQVVFEDFFLKKSMERGDGGSVFVVLVTFTLKLEVGWNVMPSVVIIRVDDVAFLSFVNKNYSHWIRNAFAIYYQAID